MMETVGWKEKTYLYYTGQRVKCNIYQFRHRGNRIGYLVGIDLDVDVLMDERKLK